MQNKCVYDLLATCIVFALVCLQAQIVIHAGKYAPDDFNTGKTQIPPNSASCLDQDGAGSGICGVYLRHGQRRKKDIQAGSFLCGKC